MLKVLPFLLQLLRSIPGRAQSHHRVMHNALCNVSSRFDDDEESRQPNNPYKTLMKQLHDWLHKIRVIGFNSGKYDLNAVKQVLVPYFLSKKEEEEEEMEQDDKEEEEEEEEEENDDVG